MHRRLRSLFASGLTAVILAGMLGLVPQAANALTPPAFEPDTNARGCLNFYDNQGNLVTTGSIADSPMVAFAQGDGPARSGAGGGADNTGTLYAYLAVPGTNPALWPGEQLSAGNSYPDPGEPANLAANPKNPTYVGASGDNALAQAQIDFPHPVSDPANYQGVYQVRFVTSGFASGTDPLYWRADIKITGNTWTQIWCQPPLQSTTVTLTATPAVQQLSGGPVTLTATVHPSGATGSIQFKDGPSNLGPAVSVTAGAASTTTNALTTVGLHSLTAAYIPDDPASFSASTSNAISLNIVATIPPVAISTTSLPNGDVGTPYSQALMATGGTGSYTWSKSGSLPAGLAFSPDGTIIGTPTLPLGTATFTVTATDTSLPPKTASAALSITINAAPSITTVSLPTGTVGSPYSTPPMAGTGGQMPYTWSISSGTLPAGLSINASTGVISGTPTGQPGTTTFTVKLTDAVGGTSTQDLSITLSPAPLVITTNSLPSGTVGRAYSFNVTATGGTQPYTWAASGLPGGITLTAQTGALSGTPTMTATASVTLTVTDSTTPAHMTVTQVFTLTVNPVPPLVITTTSLPSGMVNTAYSATIVATGGTPPYHWSLANGPVGLSLDPATGVLSGTPISAGTTTLNVQVTDSTSPTMTATQPLTLTIAPVPPVVIGTTSLPGATVGTAYSATVSASGGTAPYTWSVSAGSLPAGLSLNASTGVISGTPSVSGTASFTIRVTDSTTPTPQTATQALSITVTGGGGGGTGAGYWLVAGDGGIFTFGKVGFFGSAGALKLHGPIVGMIPTADRKGYWLVGADGGIFTYGDAHSLGSLAQHPLNKPIVGMAATPDGKGYWLVASDGGIFAFGTAGFFGSTGSLHLNKPIVGMAATPDGKGYWLVASDGGIFAFGTAGFFGSTGSLHLNSPIVEMAGG